MAKPVIAKTDGQRRAATPARQLRRVSGADAEDTQDMARGAQDTPGSGGSGGSTVHRRKGVVPPELDRLIHERLRLGIVSALAVNESMSFTEIRDLMRTTDGNLSVHARKLEDARYITVSKSFEGRVPHTVYKLTALGRRALERYLDHMESIISATRERQQ